MQAFQAEVVIGALLGLSEDAIVLQTLEPASRRRDIRGSLLSHASQLLALLHTQLATHLQLLSLASPPPPPNVSAAARTLCTSALDALDSLLAWLPPGDLQRAVPALLPLLCRALPLGTGAGVPAIPAVAAHICATLHNIVQATLSVCKCSRSTV